MKFVQNYFTNLFREISYRSVIFRQFSLIHRQDPLLRKYIVLREELFHRHYFSFSGCAFGKFPERSGRDHILATAYMTIENVVLNLLRHIRPSRTSCSVCYLQIADEKQYDFFLHYLIILQRLDSLFQAQSGLPRRDLGRCPLSGAGDLPR